MSNFIFIFKYPGKVTLPPPGLKWYQSHVVQPLWVQPRDFLEDGEPDYSSPLVIIDPISQRRRPLFSV